VIGRAAIFVFVFGALQIGWQWTDGSTLHRWVIERGVVAPTASLIAALTPELGVRAKGNRLWESRGGVNIVNGCDGMETLFLLFAGFAVAPLSVRARLFGILAGIPIVYLLNVVRILVLYYAHHTSPELFDVMHSVVTPILMVAAICVFYYFWLRQSQQRIDGSPS